MSSRTVLYDLLGVDQSATQSDIRKAYLSLAKQLHPDKLKSDDEGKSFRALKEAYDILKNPQARARYDRTGRVEDAEQSASFDEAYAFYRRVEISPQDIVNELKNYSHSKDEENDLYAFFTQHRGDVTDALKHIIGSEREDIPRFVEMWEHGLSTGALSNKYAKKFHHTKDSIGFDENSGESLGDDDSDDDEDDDENSFIVSDQEVENQEEEEEEETHVMEFTPGTDVEVDKEASMRNNVDANMVRERRVVSKKKQKSDAADDDDVDPELVAKILGQRKHKHAVLVSSLEEKYSKKKKH